MVKMSTKAKMLKMKSKKKKRPKNLSPNLHKRTDNNSCQLSLNYYSRNCSSKKEKLIRNPFNKEE